MGKVFSCGLVFSVSEPEPEGHGEPAESSDMEGLGAPDMHLSCSSVIFMKGSKRFMRKTGQRVIARIEIIVWRQRRLQLTPL